jgi:hypothetical protein
MAAVRSGGKTPEMDTHLSAGPGDPIKAAVIGGFWSLGYWEWALQEIVQVDGDDGVAMADVADMLV